MQSHKSLLSQILHWAFSLQIFLFIGACATQADDSSLVIPSKTATVIEISTATAEMSKPTEIVLTATPTFESDTPTPTITFTLPPMRLQLCSPLADQTVRELSEIVSDPYAPPPAGKDNRHHGVDFAYYRRKNRSTIEGEGVQVILGGVTRAVLVERLPYGNMVIVETEKQELPADLVDALRIDPGESLYVLYAHLGDPPLVGLNEPIECGSQIGTVGKSGYNIVNPHLHLETRIGPAGTVFEDGMAYYDTRTTEEERDNYEKWRMSGEFRHFDPMILINYYLEY